MRLQLARIAALVAAAALAAGLTGCGGSGASTPTRTIAIQGPGAGPLDARVADIRRAAALELEAIDGTTQGSKLKIVNGADPQAIATIDALAEVAISGREQLKISLAPPLVRRTKTKRQLTPEIWLLPPSGLTEAARESYAASGATGATTSQADSPFNPGTPTGQYVTPGLSAQNYPPAGQEFFEKFEKKYGRAPDRYAIFGYEAVGLIVDALTRLEKSNVFVDQTSLAKSALAIRNRYSPVGHYDVLPSGQTTLYVFQARGKGAPPGPAALIEALR
jgi:ABC-type branched-subunit amino acid transport system substrate-binding protein